MVCSVILITDPAWFAGGLDRDNNLSVGLSSVLSTVEGGHPEGVNTLTLGIQRLCVLNVTQETEDKKERRSDKRQTEIGGLVVTEYNALHKNADIQMTTLFIRVYSETKKQKQ